MRESKDVLKSADLLGKQRSLLNRHAKAFHALAYVLAEESIQSQCTESELNLLKPMLVGQMETQAFSAEL
jgi:hypothetical protein